MQPDLLHTKVRSSFARFALAGAMLAALCALVLLVDGDRAAATIADKQDDLANVRAQQDDVAADIDAANQQINALIGQVSEARQREAAAAEELAQAQDELADARDELDAGREHLKEVRDELHRAIDQLEDILVGVYKSDDPDAIRLLLESTQWEDDEVDAAYLDRLQQYQADTVQKVKDLRTEAANTVEQLADSETKIQEQRDDIQARHDELADIRAGLEAQEAQLAAAKQERAQTLAALEGREDDLQQGIARAQRRQATVPPAIDPTTGSDVAAPAPSAAPPSNGATATINSDGSASPPAGAPPQVVAVIEAANQIKDAPYAWGGGHGSFESSGYDCSGAVSYALHGGGLLSSPLDSTGFGYWGEAGEGNWITVYANSGHAFMWVAGLRWDTSDTGGSGPSWSASASSWETSQSWSVRHPAGL